MTASTNTLPIKSFSQLVQDQINSIQSSGGLLTDFQEGSILLAIIEANAANSIWIQALISAELAITRLQSSFGNNVDTFIEQFGFRRPAAVASSGSVTFSRSDTSILSYIPATSTIVSASSTNVQFTTILDTANPNYDPVTNSYVMAISAGTITVPVRCTQTGTIGNVNSGQINTINSPLTNVNTVTNASSFTNGLEAASDSQTKVDFVLYLQGLSRATYQAIQFAVLNTPTYGLQVKRYQIIENKDTSNNTLYGFFFVVVDDGTGSPSNDLINAVKANIEFYRGLSIMYDVIAPVPVTMTISAQLTLNTSADTALQTQVTANVKLALNNYINNLPIGGVKLITWPLTTSGYLYFSELFDIIFNADPNIISIPSLTLDYGSGAGTSDAPLSFKQVALTSNSDISINYTA
jgi:hypothetical protein